MIHRHRFLIPAAVLVVSIGGVALHADNWPHFRGPHAGAVADDPALPDTWSTSENVVWSVDVPGRGWSSPIVWGDHVFVASVINTAGDAPLKPVSAYVPSGFGGPIGGEDIATSASEHRWMLYDIDFHTGAVRWQREIARRVPGQPTHQKNTFASETPVTDGERVYVYFQGVGLFAFDMSGAPAWSKPMPPVAMRAGWGAAASPAIHDGRIVIVNDNEERSFIAAFDTRTGDEVWRTDRDEGSNWTTPYVWVNDARAEIVTAGSRKIRSYDLSGRLLWELSGMSTLDIPTPFARDGLLYITSGFPSDPLRPAYAIRPGASGDISLKPGETGNVHVAWFHPTLGPYNPSALAYSGHYYTLFDRGFLTSHDARTGAEVYGRQRITSEASGFTASPWAYNGKIFAMSEDGDTFVIQAGPEFRVLGRNRLDEMTLATPAVVRGSLIIRTASKLYRIARTAGPPI
jgi:outer membrane protein assembly factor BamB